MTGEALIPVHTVGRMPRYLWALEHLAERGESTTSSAELGELAGVGSTQLRKDLSYLRSPGQRGVGYDVSSLRERITEVLGVTDVQNLVVIGVGNLGRAVAQYRALRQRGFEVVALVDSADDVVGSQVAGLRVEPVGDLPMIVRNRGVTIAVLTTPAEAAQRAADAAVAAGLRSILNFAPGEVRVPDGVQVRALDLGSELQILAFQSRSAGSLRRGARADNPEKTGWLTDAQALGVGPGSDSQ